MSEHCEERDQLKAKGVSDQQADELTARKADLERFGVPWTKIIDLVSRYGPVVVEILKELLSDEMNQKGSKAPESGKV